MKSLACEVGRKRGRGREVRKREKTGGLGAKDEGSPTTETASFFFFSFLRPPAAAKSDRLILDSKSHGNDVI